MIGHFNLMPAVALAGWMLISATWQGTAISLGAAALLHWMRDTRASARYTVAVVALAAMVAVPLATTLLRPERALDSIVDAGNHNAVRNAHVRAPDRTTVLAPRAHLSRVMLPRGAAIAVTVADALPWIVSAWLAGVILLSLRLLGGVARVRELSRDGIECTDAWIAEMARQIAARLGIHRGVRILESSRVTVPMVVGWIAPIVLMPASLLTGLTPAQLEMLLAHELAHVRRYDTVVNLAQRVIETLLFFHPGVWWLSARVRDEREHCCDDLAIAVTGGDRLSYGATLVMMEELRGSPPMLASAANSGSLLRRIRRIVDGDADRGSAGQAWLASMISLAAILVVAGTVGARTSEPRRTTITVAPVVQSLKSEPATRRLAHSSAHDTSHRSPTMLRHSVAVAAASLALVTTNTSTVAAQATPQQQSFAGHWTLIGCSGCADSADIAVMRTRDAIVPGWGGDMTILQDSTALTAIDNSAGAVRTIYRLTAPWGTLVSTGGVTGSVHVSIRMRELQFTQPKPTWIADTLVIQALGRADSTSASFTVSLYRDADGDLVAEWTLREVSYYLNGERVHYSSDEPSAFRGTRSITLRYRKA